MERERKRYVAAVKRWCEENRVPEGNRAHALRTLRSGLRQFEAVLRRGAPKPREESDGR